MIYLDTEDYDYVLSRISDIRADIKELQVELRRFQAIADEEKETVDKWLACTHAWVYDEHKDWYICSKCDAMGYEEDE